MTVPTKRKLSDINIEISTETSPRRWASKSSSYRNAVTEHVDDTLLLSPNYYYRRGYRFSNHQPDDDTKLQKKEDITPPEVLETTKKASCSNTSTSRNPEKNEEVRRTWRQSYSAQRRRTDNMNDVFNTLSLSNENVASYFSRRRHSRCCNRDTPPTNFSQEQFNFNFYPAPIPTYNQQPVIKRPVKLSHSAVSAKKRTEYINCGFHYLEKDACIEGTPPSARTGFAVAQLQGAIYVFGGQSSHGLKLNDVHVLLSSIALRNNWVWNTVDTSSSISLPQPRTLHTLVAVSEAGSLYLFGGYGYAGALGDLWKFTPHEWSLTAVYSSRDNIYTQKETNHDVIKNVSGTWEEIRTLTPSPLPRMGHSCTSGPNGFYLFGGMASYAHDTHLSSACYSVRQIDKYGTFSYTSAPHIPEFQETECEVNFPQSGEGNSRRLADLWYFNTSKDSWTGLSLYSPEELYALRPVATIKSNNVEELTQSPLTSPTIDIKNIAYGGGTRSFLPLLNSNNRTRESLFPDSLSRGASSFFEKEEESQILLKQNLFLTPDVKDTSGTNVSIIKSHHLEDQRHTEHVSFADNEEPQQQQQQQYHPPSRWLHVSTKFENKIFVFGGRGNPKNQLLYDMWHFDLDLKQWNLDLSSHLPFQSIEHLWFPVNAVLGDCWIISPSLLFNFHTYVLNFIIAPPLNFSGGMSRHLTSLFAQCLQKKRRFSRRHRHFYCTLNHKQSETTTSQDLNQCSSEKLNTTIKNDQITTNSNHTISNIYDIETPTTVSSPQDRVKFMDEFNTTTTTILHNKQDNDDNNNALLITKENHNKKTLSFPLLNDMIMTPPSHISFNRDIQKQKGILKRILQSGFYHTLFSHCMKCNFSSNILCNDNYSSHMYMDELLFDIEVAKEESLHNSDDNDIWCSELSFESSTLTHDDNQTNDNNVISSKHIKNTILQQQQQEEEEEDYFHLNICPALPKKDNFNEKWEESSSQSSYNSEVVVAEEGEEEILTEHHNYNNNLSDIFENPVDDDTMMMMIKKKSYNEFFNNTSNNSIVSSSSSIPPPYYVSKPVPYSKSSSAAIQIIFTNSMCPLQEIVDEKLKKFGLKHQREKHQAANRLPEIYGIQNPTHRLSQLFCTSQTLKLKRKISVTKHLINNKNPLLKSSSFLLQQHPEIKHVSNIPITTTILPQKLTKQHSSSNTKYFIGQSTYKRYPDKPIFYFCSDTKLMPWSPYWRDASYFVSHFVTSKNLKLMCRRRNHRSLQKKKYSNELFFSTPPHLKKEQEKLLVHQGTTTIMDDDDVLNYGLQLDDGQEPFALGQSVITPVRGENSKRVLLLCLGCGLEDFPVTMFQCNWKDINMEAEADLRVGAYSTEGHSNSLRNFTTKLHYRYYGGGKDTKQQQWNNETSSVPINLEIKKWEEPHICEELQFDETKISCKRNSPLHITSSSSLGSSILGNNNDDKEQLIITSSLNKNLISKKNSNNFSIINNKSSTPFNRFMSYTKTRRSSNIEPNLQNPITTQLVTAISTAGKRFFDKPPSIRSKSTMFLRKDNNVAESQSKSYSASQEKNNDFKNKNNHRIPSLFPETETLNAVHRPITRTDSHSFPPFNLKKKLIFVLPEIKIKNDHVVDNNITHTTTEKKNPL